MWLGGFLAVPASGLPVPMMAEAGLGRCGESWETTGVPALATSLEELAGTVAPPKYARVDLIYCGTQARRHRPYLSNKGL
jgi:hypothetical protein